MTTTIKKWGNSAGIRLSKALLLQIGLSIDSPIDMRIKGDTITIKKRDEIEELPTMEELCAQITPKNRHSEIDWGHPVGKEIW